MAASVKENDLNSLEEENQRLRTALRYYADKEHLAGKGVEPGLIASRALRGIEPMDEETLDEAAVDRFALAMKRKLSSARKKGRSGWIDTTYTPSDNLARGLVGHIFKGNQGNYEDIANFCMMLHQRGDSPSVLQKVVDTDIIQALQTGTIDELARKFPVVLRKMWSGGEVRDWLKSHRFETA